MNEVGALQYQIHLAHASEPVAEEARLRPILEDVTQDVKTPLVVLLCAVGCMLLIACLNVSNLLVARSAARRKELAVRGALGGSRLVLIGEQMAESLLISLAGGTLGVLLSFGATRWLAEHWSDLPRADSIHLDGTVLAFALRLVFITALMAGLLPAISSTGSGIFAALQESSRSIGGSLSKATLRKTLLTVEIALTVILLVSAGLLFKSFLHLRTSNLGCVTDHVLTMKYGLPEKQYDTREKVIAFHEGLFWNGYAGCRACKRRVWSPPRRETVGITTACSRFQSTRRVVFNCRTTRLCGRRSGLFQRFADTVDQRAGFYRTGAPRSRPVHGGQQEVCG